MKNSLPKLSVVLGGSNSGKSRYAELRVVASGRSRVYLATAQAWDDEMRAKIDAHRADRGGGWTTIEAPLSAAEELGRIAASDIVLLDCATMWLNNHMMAENDIEAEQARLLDAIAACAAPVVVVSNEVGLGGIQDNALARQFGRAQGRLNHALAHQAELVVFVAAGLPLVLKGSAE